MLDLVNYEMFHTSVTKPQAFKVSKDPTDGKVDMEVQAMSYKNEWGVSGRCVRPVACAHVVFVYEIFYPKTTKRSICTFFSEPTTFALRVALILSLPVAVRYRFCFFIGTGSTALDG